MIWKKLGLTSNYHYIGLGEINVFNPHFFFSSTKQKNKGVRGSSVEENDLVLSSRALSFLSPGQFGGLITAASPLFTFYPSLARALSSTLMLTQW